MPRERATSPLFLLVAMIAVLAALYLAKQILLPIALAVMLCFLLTPLANRVERWGLARIPSVLLVVAVAFAILGLVGWVVTGQLIELGHELPHHRQQIVEKIRALRAVTERMEQVGSSLAKDGTDGSRSDQPTPREQPKPETELPIDRPGPAESAKRPNLPNPIGPALEAGENLPSDSAVPVKVVALPPSPLTQVQTWLGPLVAPITTAGMVIVLVFFILLDRENQRNRLIQLFGTTNLRATTEALRETTQRVGRYLRMLFLINATYGMAVWLGLWVLGIPGAMMWGVLGFSLRFLPYLGPWIASVLPIMVALAVSPNWTQPMLVAGMYIVYELVLNNVAEPLLYGSSIGVSTVGVIVSAIFWTWLWGPIGLVLAMPMTVCLVVLARYVPELRFVNVLLADQPPLTPAERIYQRLLALDDREPMKLAGKHLKTSSLVSFYDEALIPALVLAEQDRYAGQLDEEQEEFVVEAARDMVEELGGSVFAAHALGSATDGAVPVATADEEAIKANVLCVPLRDEADEIACRMLAQLLTAEGFKVETGTAELLASEILDRVAETDSELVVISVLPPIRPRDSRLLWKRLKQRYPELPILIGYWVGTSDDAKYHRPAPSEENNTATTLAEAVALVRSTAARLQLTKKAV